MKMQVRSLPFGDNRIVPCMPYDNPDAGVLPPNSKPQPLVLASHIFMDTNQAHIGWQALTYTDMLVGVAVSTHCLWLTPTFSVIGKNHVEPKKYAGQLSLAAAEPASADE